MNIIAYILPKIRVIFIAIMILTPCFIEANTGYNSKMSSELTGGFPLPFEFMAQDIFQKVEFSFIGIDGFNSMVERYNQVIASFYLSLFPVTQTCEPVSGDIAEQNDACRNESDDYWSVYISILSMFIAFFLFSPNGITT